MSGSYSEILGKPLVMNVSEEHIHSQATTASSSVPCHTPNTSNNTSSETQASTSVGSNSSSTKREINSGFIYKPPKLSPCHSCSSAKESLLRHSKVSKPSTLPQLHSSTSNGIPTNKTCSYYQYYSSTNTDHADPEVRFFFFS